MPKLRKVMKPLITASAVMALCMPLLLEAQSCCGEKEGEKVCTEVCEKSGYLGITGTDLTDGLRKALKIESGAVVETIAEGSPAEKAGIKIGDVIVEADQQKITDFESLRKIVAAKPSEKMKMVILRDGKKISTEATLGVKEKKEIMLKMSLPDIDFNFENFKDLLGKGTNELKKQIEELKVEIEKLKAEVEKLKSK